MGRVRKSRKSRIKIGLIYRSLTTLLLTLVIMKHNKRLEEKADNLAKKNSWLA